MKIVVIGGTGLIGSKLVPKLREQGHEALAASLNTGVNAVTGEGLAEALQGASVVVDVSNSPSWEDAAVMRFFETSTRNLLSSEMAAGVKHHLALSVEGTDRMLASGYFRAKMAQENLIKDSSIPYSIVRATQFFEFAKGIAQDGPVSVGWGGGWHYDGDEVGGQFSGAGVLVNDAKDRFEGVWVAGKMTGHGTLVRANGERYDGEWKGGTACAGQSCSDRDDS